MNSAQIRATIERLLTQGSSSTSLQISNATFSSPKITALLNTYYGGTDLTLQNATLLPPEEGSADIIVNGISSFLNIANLATHAIFQEAAEGIDLILEYELPPTWKFSQSFPHLPVPLDFYAPSEVPQQAHLDLMTLLDARFFVSTRVYGEPRLQVQIEPGLYFASRLLLNGMLGGIEQFLTDSPELILSGPILLPTLSQRVVQPLLPSELPFRDSTSRPGINLKAEIETTFAYEHFPLSGLYLRIYCPLTDEWFQDNPTYRPVLCFGGALQFGTTAALEFLAEKLPDVDNALLFTGVFEGLDLASLSDLADLVGGDDLHTFLTPPDPAPAFFSDLGRLSLEAVSIAITTNPPGVDWVSATVGLENVVWQALDGLMSVSNLSLFFQMDNPFNAQRDCSVMLFGEMEIGGVPISITASGPDFALEAELAAEVSLPLSTLMSTFLPEVPAVSNLTVDQIYLEAIPGSAFSLIAALADTPESWVIDLGPTPLTVSDVQLVVNYNRGTGASGAFGGTLSLAGIDLALVYQIPGSFMLRGQFPALSLQALVEELCGNSLPWPSGFDIDLENASVLIQEQNGHLSLNVAAQIKDLGMLALTIQRQDTWGFALGLDLTPGNLSALPGLGLLAPFEALIGTDNLLLIFSSLDQPPNFQFPDIVAFQAPALGSRNIVLPAQASGLVRGLNLYALLQTSHNVGFMALARYLRVRLDGSIGITLALSLPDPLTNTRLFLAVRQEILRGTTLAGEVGVLLQGSDVGAFLSATVKTKIQGQPAQFDVTAVVLATGVLISGSMRGTIRFSSIQISNLALVIGIDLEGIPSLGVAATLDVSTFDSALALFFDSADPAKSLLAGALSNLTLRDVALTLAGQKKLPPELDTVLGGIALKGLAAFNLPATVGQALDHRDLSAISAAFQQYGHLAFPATSDCVLLVINQSGHNWHLTDMTTMKHYSLELHGSSIVVILQPQLYLAPQATMIGSIQYPQSFSVSAAIDFVLIHAQINIQISPMQGIMAEIDLTPIVLFNQNFFAISAAKGSGGPHLSLATYPQPALSDPQMSKPHFLLSGNIQLLGVDLVGIYLLINDRGLTFQFAGQINPALHLELTGSFDIHGNLTVAGTILVGINNVLDLGPQGRIPIAVNVSGSLRMGYTAGSASATFRGSYMFQNISASIPPLTLQVTGPALKTIGDLLWQQIRDITIKQLQDPQQWLSWVQSGVIQLARRTAAEIGRVLATVYHLSGNEIATSIRQTLHYGIVDLTQALQGAGSSANDAVNILKSLGYPAADISLAIPGVFHGTHADVNLDHTDTPPGFHTDNPQSHEDTPQQRINTYAHTDIPSSHIDTKLHIDIPHVDVLGRTITPHGDGPGEVRTPHGDRNDHTDQVVIPHTDNPIPHTDSYVPPHGDITSHVDVNS